MAGCMASIASRARSAVPRSTVLHVLRLVHTHYIPIHERSPINVKVGGGCCWAGLITAEWCPLLWIGSAERDGSYLGRGRDRPGGFSARSLSIMAKTAERCVRWGYAVYRLTCRPKYPQSIIIVSQLYHAKRQHHTTASLSIKGATDRRTCKAHTVIDIVVGSALPEFRRCYGTYGKPSRRSLDRCVATDDIALVGWSYEIEMAVVSGKGVGNDGSGSR